MEEIKIAARRKTIALMKSKIKRRRRWGMIGLLAYIEFGTGNN